MRKIFYTLILATLLAFVSCDNEPAIARDDAPRGTARTSSLRTIDEAIDIANSSASFFFGEAIAIISGSTSDSGHAWILDGVKRYSTVHTVYYREKDTDQWQVMSRSSDLMHYNHFNWGWGTKCVGWFNDNVFRGDRYSTLDDSSVLPTEDDGKTVKPQKDYCKNVKFFIVRD